LRRIPPKLRLSAAAINVFVAVALAGGCARTDDPTVQAPVTSSSSESSSTTLLADGTTTSAPATSSTRVAAALPQSETATSAKSPAKASVPTSSAPAAAPVRARGVWEPVPASADRVPWPGWDPPAPPGDGRTYYLSASGDDGRPGTSPETAWRSLSRASATSLRPGDRLLLARGSSFPGRLDLKASGTEAAPIVVTAYGDGPAPQITGDCVDVIGSHIVLSDLDVHDCSFGGISLSGSSNRIQDNTVRHNAAGIFVRRGSSGNKILGNRAVDNTKMSVLTKTPKSDDSGAFGILLNGDANEVAYNVITGSVAPSYDFGTDGGAIEIYAGRDNLIHHNIARGNKTFTELGDSRSAGNTFSYNVIWSDVPEANFLVTRGGDDGFGPVTGTTLEHNTAVLTGPGSEGFVCHGGCSPEILSMRNNIVEARGKVGFADAPFDEDSNLFWGGPRQFTPGPNSQVADPRFVDRANGDFRLRPDSPALDQAEPVASGADAPLAAAPKDGDRDGEATPDVGAYEAGS
jgi:parallel beta-helix repeat protein